MFITHSSGDLANFAFMSSIRQHKIEAAIRTELATYLQKHTNELCMGSMVTVTIIRVTSDLSLARCYLSFFAGLDKKVVLDNINLNKGKIRMEIAKRLKNMRKIPELLFFIDDSLDYAEEINQLLNK
jgi:ribosome-binding factor A